MDLELKPQISLFKWSSQVKANSGIGRANMTQSTAQSGSVKPSAKYKSTISIIPC